MQWRIDVALRAAEAIRALDRALRDEFIVRVDAISADPLAHVRHSLPPFEPIGAWVYEYASEVVPDIIMLVIFAEPDTTTHAITMIHVRSLSRGVED
ncbi:MAG: hypothetical protein KF902_01155 [Phycisphaeraceae bacterium]|nr:hypothetical protein [Phycisphaeraceae bacterium]